MEPVRRPTNASLPSSHIVAILRRTPTTADRHFLAERGVLLLGCLNPRTFFARWEPKAGIQSETVVELLEAIAPVERRRKVHPAIESWVRVRRLGGNGESAIGGGPGSGQREIAALVLLHPDVPVGSELNRLQVEFPIRIHSHVEALHLLVIEAAPETLIILADEDSVQWIEPALPPLNGHNDGVRRAVQADAMTNDPHDGPSGSGQFVLVYDVGSVESIHPDLVGRVENQDSEGVSDHSTHVAGTIAGSGAASGGRYAGVAPGVRIVSFAFHPSGGSSGLPLYSDPGDLAGDYATAIVQGVRVANNSIGTNLCVNDSDCRLAGDYGLTSHVIDSFVAGDLGPPVTSVWSAGNERNCGRCVVEGGHTEAGYHSIAPPAGAKNAIVVGAVNSHDESMTPFSSWGPTDDGRLKPDLVAPGCQVGGDYGVTSTFVGGGYAAFCGTSMSAPVVTGLAAILNRELEASGRLSTAPRPAMIKALILHGTRDVGLPGPDFQSGFGSVRFRRTLEAAGSAGLIQSTVEHDQFRSFQVRIPASGSAFRATLVWDDVPSTPNVATTLVNDLDLRVFDPSGVRRFPWTLDAQRPALPAVQSLEDHRNNVEQVEVFDPIPGLWTVQVFGYAVPAGPQSFALVVEPELETDCDQNGVPDVEQVAGAPKLDCVGDGVPDACRPDCDQSGLPDGCEALAGTIADCNVNGLADSCEPDCNVNGTPDDCDVRGGSSGDCNRDGVPDECTADCDGNGTPDHCEIASGSAEDCDDDGRPDVCQDTSSDCNGNDLWDACEAARQPFLDLNGNRVPDECETPRVIHVLADACSGVEDGSAARPFCRIQDAIGASRSGDEIVVAPGVYGGPGNHDLDFEGRAITLRSTVPDDPGVVIRTIVDARRSGRGAYFHSGESSDSVLAGLTIRRGVASEGSSAGLRRGGGIYCVDSSPTITRCVIEDCAVGPSLNGVDGGGGIYLERSQAVIDRCVIHRNQTFNNGGGLYAVDRSRPVIRGSRIEGNIARFGGGALGVSLDSDVLILNSQLSSNLASQFGGGVWVLGGRVTLRGCTVTGNGSALAGGGLYAAGGEVDIRDCILFDNLSDRGRELRMEAQSVATVTFSILSHHPYFTSVDDDTSLVRGAGVLDRNPELEWPIRSSRINDLEPSMVFRLKPTSPCIDAGGPFRAGDGEQDVEGDARQAHCRVDIGADESPFFRDCNSDGAPDACEVLADPGQDADFNGVPDECQQCVTDDDCENGLYCDGVESCMAGDCTGGNPPCPDSVCDESGDRCVECLADQHCDDGNPCTQDACAEGTCRHLTVSDCGPLLALHAVRVNSLPISPVDRLALKPGDRVTVEASVASWAPQSIGVFQIQLDTAGLDSPGLGGLRLAVQGTTSVRALIDQGRPEFLFFGKSTIMGVDASPDRLRMGGLSLFEGIPDRGARAYCATFDLRVSDDAAGSMIATLDPDPERSFLLRRDGQLLGPVRFTPLHIHVPIEGCTDPPDCNANGLTDECDLALGVDDDCDGNGRPDACDLSSGLFPDCNANLIPDVCDPDCDDNGVPDDCELASGTGDCNLNGIPDPCEDCNGNGVADECDRFLGVSRDCNHNAVNDECDLSDATSLDCNGNSQPDECDLAEFSTTDCNRNDIPDPCDLAAGIAQDCNENGVADDCEDCNGNGLADECDVESGRSGDCNGDGVPDECQDCNGNGRADSCDIAGDVSADCDGNGVPDECEDCNGNGTADSCDIASGSSDDLNRDGLPDECDPCASLACSNGAFCDGLEFCVGGACRPGVEPCQDGPCDELSDRCVSCLEASDCDDDNPCTFDRCQEGRCAYGVLTDPCDDSDRCTVDDRCVTGGCGGIWVPGCGARVSWNAVAVNGWPVPSGSSSLVSTAPGDAVECEIRIAGWRPDLLKSFELVLDPSGLSSGFAGRLEPAFTPDRRAGAFVDETRPEFTLNGRRRLVRVIRDDPAYRYEGTVLDAGVADTSSYTYAGSLKILVSEDAAGAFSVALDSIRSRLMDPAGRPISPLVMDPLRIIVPPPGCDGLPDCDGNGLTDSCDIDFAMTPDCNGNGVPDLCDARKNGGLDDCDGNGVPDECDPDCDHDGIPDACVLQHAVDRDCNANGVPDRCEDCDENGFADECDLAGGSSQDCNQNLRPDSCDVIEGWSNDCDLDGVPDECAPDCDGNGIKDACDIRDGTRSDADGNGVPDSCQRLLNVPGDFPSIREAIEDARSGDTILVAPGLYSGLMNRRLSFSGQTLHLRCGGRPGDCVLDGGGEPVLELTGREPPQTRIEGLTLRGGTGAFVEASSPTFMNCIISDNPHGGVVCSGGGRPSLIGCVMARNQADVGAALVGQYCQLEVRNCTIVGNHSRWFGGALFAESSQVQVNSTIFRNNASVLGPPIELRFQSSLSVAYSNVESGISGIRSLDSTIAWGPGNVDRDPRFADEPALDVHLNPDSACINAGDPDPTLTNGERDLDGEPRLQHGRRDIGADEASMFLDCNRNEIPDWADVNPGGDQESGSSDCDGNGIPDECEDCDGNGLADACDLISLPNADCNHDAVLDVCEGTGSGWLVAFTDPPDGAIDARQPVDPVTGSLMGWSSVRIVTVAPIGTLSLAEFSVIQEPPGSPVPRPRAINRPAANVIEVIFDRPISPGAWTTVSYPCAPWSMRLGFLPGDVDGDGGVSGGDLISLVDVLNHMSSRPEWSTDMDRSGVTAPGDLARLVDLLNGIGPFDPWFGRSLP